MTIPEKYEDYTGYVSFYDPDENGTVSGYLTDGEFLDGYNVSNIKHEEEYDSNGHLQERKNSDGTVERFDYWGNKHEDDSKQMGGTDDDCEFKLC